MLNKLLSYEGQNQIQENNNNLTSAITIIFLKKVYLKWRQELVSEMCVCTCACVSNNLH